MPRAERGSCCQEGVHISRTTCFEKVKKYNKTMQNIKSIYEVDFHFHFLNSFGLYRTLKKSIFVVKALQRRVATSC